MFAKMIAAALLVLTSTSAFASDRGPERRPAYSEKIQKAETRAPSATTKATPAATPEPTHTACRCTK